MAPRVAPAAPAPAPSPAEMKRDDVLPFAATPQKVGGLTPLEGVRSFRVLQHGNKWIEACTGCEFKNRYVVLDNASGMALLEANEESDFCMRCCLDPQHEATLRFTDLRPGVPADSLVFQANKPTNCFKCFSLWRICRAEITTSDAQGALLGQTQEHWCTCGTTLRMDVADKTGAKFAQVNGPQTCFGGLASMICDSTFDIVDVDAAESKVGHIKQLKPETFQRALEMAFTSKDVFEITVPETWSEERKANIIATAILIDYMLFEEAKQGYCCSLYCSGCVCVFQNDRNNNIR